MAADPFLGREILGGQFRILEKILPTLDKAPDRSNRDVQPGSHRRRSRGQRSRSRRSERWRGSRSAAR